MADLAFLWHMHQPDYRHPDSGEFLLPWVFLHAIKDYTDMAAHLERHPHIRCTVNFVPVLLDQIEDYADQFATGQWRDPLLRIAATPDPTKLRQADRDWLLDMAFRCHAPTMLEPFAHYRRLRDLKQGRDGMRQTVVDMAAAANRAEAAVAALRQSAQTAAVELAARQAQAKAAADELSMLVSAADGLAERLVTNAQARRQPARPVDLVSELRGARCCIWGISRAPGVARAAAGPRRSRRRTGRPVSRRSPRPRTTRACAPSTPPARWRATRRWPRCRWWRSTSRLPGSIRRATRS